MAKSIYAIANFTGFSRQALDRRVSHFNLDPNDLDPRDLLSLRPLADAGEGISLQEARTEQAIEDAGLKRVRRLREEGELIPVDDVRAAGARVAAAINKVLERPCFTPEQREELGLAFKEAMGELAEPG